MKRKLSFLLVLAFLVIAVPSLQAADKKSEKKVKKEMKRKAHKAARKEARKYKRSGWYIAPGALPMDNQVEKSWQRQYEEDEDGYPPLFILRGLRI